MASAALGEFPSALFALMLRPPLRIGWWMLQRHGVVVAVRPKDQRNQPLGRNNAKIGNL
jgi:hypothetical protein